ncbi:hypothetical protein G5V59_09705 [Nocardioides sp. W3-2-3]|uniref:hypothetical protein n=1 Tax=Nocardioides convexus TaxID=2712224 RepID=UPI0024181706|nr:hypothetical protein [Nocardioides convexus]NHA00283.1 hypothetical protein [Nocardioides convexus]
MWSASLDPATGLTVDGWHPVGVPDPAVAPVGTPSVVYDPQTQRNGILVRSGATSTGALYRVWESTPGSGDFSGAFTGVSLESSGVASDLTTWDYRTEEPLYRRWSLPVPRRQPLPTTGDQLCVVTGSTGSPVFSPSRCWLPCWWASRRVPCRPPTRGRAARRPRATTSR